MLEKKGSTEILSNLTDQQLEVITRICKSFEKGVSIRINSDSDLCREYAFVEYFADLFSVYHSITEHKFEKKSFEFAFKYASIAAGHSAEVNTNSSFQGADVIRDGVKFSLKTEGEKSKSSIKVSKFSEARFIAKYKTENEERSIKDSNKTSEEKRYLLEQLEERKNNILMPELANDLRRVISHHLSSYERIIVLKANKHLDSQGEIVLYNYRLIEIPLETLREANKLDESSLTPLHGNGGTSATINSSNGEKLFGINVDGSVEKISLTGIKINKCITHAEFIVPVSLL